MEGGASDEVMSSCASTLRGGARGSISSQQRSRTSSMSEDETSVPVVAASADSDAASDCTDFTPWEFYAHPLPAAATHPLPADHPRGPPPARAPAARPRSVLTEDAAHRAPAALRPTSAASKQYRRSAASTDNGRAAASPAVDSATTDGDRFVARITVSSPRRRGGGTRRRNCAEVESVGRQDCRQRDDYRETTPRPPPREPRDGASASDVGGLGVDDRRRPRTDPSLGNGSRESAREQRRSPPDHGRSTQKHRGSASTESRSYERRGFHRGGVVDLLQEADSGAAAAAKGKNGHMPTPSNGVCSASPAVGAILLNRSSPVKSLSVDDRSPVGARLERDRAADSVAPPPPAAVPRRDSYAETNDGGTTPKPTPKRPTTTGATAANCRPVSSDGDAAGRGRFVAADCDSSAASRNTSHEVPSKHRRKVTDSPVSVADDADDGEVNLAPAERIAYGKQASQSQQALFNDASTTLVNRCPVTASSSTTG